MPKLLHYVTAREGEEPEQLAKLVVKFARSGRPIGIGWQDEEALDRDDRGVLWGRMSQNRDYRGELWGRPLFSMMHTSRQREAMSALRCSVCMGQPSRTRKGFLFLLDLRDDTPLEGRLTAQPPLCLPHAVYGINRCSYLRGGWLLVRARVPRLHGVTGDVYQPGDEGLLEPVPQPPGPAGALSPFRYADREVLRWVLASHMVRRLTGVTVVQLGDELAEVSPSTLWPAAAWP